MAQKKVRIGFIGCGGIHWPHLDGYLQIPEQCQVVACCDVDAAKAKASAAKAGTAAVFTDWKKMLKEVELDAVDICLPHHLHKPSIIDSAKAGKHIICEKPLCLNMQEARAIEKVVKKNRIIYMSAHNQIFDPIIREAKRLLESGAIGKVYYLRTQDCFVAGRFIQGRKHMGWRGDVKKQGGGELIDTGYHPSYLLLFLAGSPIEEVVAATNTFALPMDAEDTAAVTVKFKNGSIGQILTSWAMPNPVGAHQIHAIGCDGQLYGSRKDLYILPRGFTEPAHMEFQAVPGIHTEVKHFVECIREKKKPVTDLQQGIDVLDLILRATKGVKPRAKKRKR
jgi:predicted dehydrogenase